MSWWWGLSLLVASSLSVTVGFVAGAAWQSSVYRNDE